MVSYPSGIFMPGVDGGGGAIGPAGIAYGGGPYELGAGVHLDGVACHDPDGAEATPVDFRFAAGVEEDGAGDEGFEPSVAAVALEGGSFLFLIAAL